MPRLLECACQVWQCSTDSLSLQVMLIPNATGSLPAPIAAPGPAPAVSPAAGGSQTIVATFDLVGQGLNPLSSKDSDALLAVVNKTVAAHGATVTSIRLGQVQVCKQQDRKGA